MLARRAVETEMPIMVQGVVYWQPPKQALDKVKELIWDPSVSRYGADEGLPQLREALTKKLRVENKLLESSVMVTAGANQAKQVVISLEHSESR